MSMAKRKGIGRKPHENGPWSLDDGLFVNAYASEACTNDPAVYLDMGDGTLLKAGDADMVKRYAATHIDALRKAGLPDMASCMAVIEFDRYPDARLSADQICTCMNYLNNCLGPERVNELLSMDEASLKAELNKLYEIGF